MNMTQKALPFLLMALSLGACGTLEKKPEPPPEPLVKPLRVGVTPHFPPLVFNQQGELAGIEVDLMRRVGRELERPVTAVVLHWDELINALLAGKVDVIMSGMSVTDSRKLRIGFTDPWMNTGLMAMMRHKDAYAFQSAGDVLKFRGRIGVVPGTTGHDYVRRSCPDARLVRIATPEDAAVQLQRNVIDLFIHDIPTILWLVSTHEAELSALMKRLDAEHIAWGVRREDRELTGQLNRALGTWKADGSLEASILKWIPYYDSIK